MKRKVLALVLAVTCAMSLTACGKAAGELPSDAASRSIEDADTSVVYFDEEAVALAGELAGSNEALLAAAQEAVTEVNEIRSESGLGELEWNGQLADAAYVRAQEIVGTFSHTRPDGSEWWTVDSTVMYGENLAKNYNTSSAVVDAWMASPTHQANIMKADYETIGIAVYQTEAGNWYWAQEFGY
ncbi:MAG: CAP domain-containing protein [Lachnospiraceae bacterium]|nr:CAP domain-containing protein [Lachnospiraceae bacterium]